MKKVLMIAAIVAMMGVSANAMTYECWSYKNGQLDKSFNVEANNQGEAESKAWDKFYKLWEYRPDAIKCK